ncbi:MAG: tRNA pseudouridine(13) synthase TruD [Bermanella sp.]
MTEFNSQWPTAYPKLAVKGFFRTQLEDFQVTELSNRQLHASGPHLFLFIEKQGTNTHWLARKLANHAKVDLKAVGYAGLKDRHAITRQWFSIPYKDKLPDLSHVFSKPEFTLLSQGFYGVKLKRGALGGNAFRIVLRNMTGDKQAIEQRLELIRQRGVPNYFGRQRFGNDGDNLQQAHNMFANGKRPRNKQKGSMYISAARSFLFNEMLAKRIELNSWDRPMAGEVFGFAGSLRGFSQEGSSEELQRWRTNRIHPTCALWGKNESLAAGELLAIEDTVAAANPVFCEGLVNKGLKQERRAARMLVPDLFWMWQGDDLVLRFSLASGYFATSILAELGDIQEAPREYYAEQEASQ